MPNPFRIHRRTDDAHVPAPGTYELLIQEWIRLVASPASAMQLRKWARSERALRGVDDFGELVDAIDTAAGEGKDEILLALIRTFQAGHQLAGRVVLQALMPKLAHFARQGFDEARDNHEESRQVVIATFWGKLADYRPDRAVHGVAGTLALNTLHELTEHRRRGIAERATDPQSIDWPRAQRYFSDENVVRALTVTRDGRKYLPINHDDQVVIDEYDIGRGLDPEHLDGVDGVVTVLQWALGNGAISRTDAELLARIYTSPTGWTDAGMLPHVAAAAAAEGVTPAAIRKRCSRVVQQLATAVRADIDAQGELYRATA